MSIDEIRGRLEAATPGPWETRTDDLTKCTLCGRESRCHALDCPVAQPIRSGGQAVTANAEFIAHAPEDMRRLLNAIEAVQKLHYQQEDEEEVIAWSCMDGPCEHGDDVCPEVMIRPCAECSTPEFYIEWPCPTVKALTVALEAES